MHFEIGHHAKSRTRSIQLEKGVEVAARETSKTESARDEHSAPPVLATRSSSVPSGKENMASEQKNYRSMLDVEGPPKLGPMKTFTYDELYVDNSKLLSTQALPAPASGIRTHILIFLCSFYEPPRVRMKLTILSQLRTVFPPPLPLSPGRPPLLRHQTASSPHLRTTSLRNRLLLTSYPQSRL